MKNSLSRVVNLIDFFRRKDFPPEIEDFVPYEMRKIRTFRPIGEKVYNFLVKEIDRHSITFEKLCKKSWNKKKYGPGTLENALKNIFEGIKGSMVSSYVNKQKALWLLAYTEVLRNHFDQDLYFQELENGISKLDDTENVNSFLTGVYSYNLKSNLYYSPFYDKQKPEAQELLSSLEKQLKKSMYRELVKIHIEFLQRKFIRGEDYEHQTKFVQHLLEDAKKNEVFQKKEVELLKLYIIWLDGNMDFIGLKTINDDFLREYECLSKWFNMIFVGYLINQFIVLYNKEPAAQECANRLYILGIDSNLLLTNGVLPYDHFINSIMLDCDVRMSKNMDNSEEYLLKRIIQTSRFLPERIQEQSKLLTQKYVLFKLKRYEKARSVYIESVDNVSEFLRYQAIDLCCYFALRDKYFIELTKKFKKYLSDPSTEIAEESIANNKRLIEYLSKLWNLRDAGHHDDNGHEVEKALFFLEKDIKYYKSVQQNWLIDQCNVETLFKQD